MSEQQMREAFEKAFPMPPECMWCGHGYAAKEYNAWDAHNYCERWIGWRAALSQPAPQGVAEVMEAPEWAELYRLREAVKGPAGFATWQDAATDERVRRVKAEARVAELEVDAARWRKFAYEGIEVSASKNVPEHILVMARLDTAGMTFICEVGDYEKAVDAAIAASKEAL